MRRYRLALTLLTLAVVAVGCSTGYGQGPIYDRRYPDDRRYPNERRYPDDRRSGYYNRVQHDVNEYVRHLDRNLRLERRQAQRIQRLLDERTVRLLERTRPYDHRRVYPFPRRTDRRQDPVVDRWWRDTDRQLERQLDRWQRDEYRYMTRQYEDRYRRDDRYRRNDGRYRRNDGRYRRNDGRYRRNDNHRYEKKRHDDDDDDGGNRRRGDDDDDD